MMAVQQKRKPCVRRAVLISIFAVVLAYCRSTVPPVNASTTERIVTDYHTGLAISGFDPVAYFTNSRAAIGRDSFEVRYAGATWRFINAGNREAFLENPEVYMPMFGGHDPTGVARGVAVAGHPEVWLIAGERLYLFRSRQTRDSFIAAPGQVIENGRKQWPELESKLVQ